MTHKYSYPQPCPAFHGHDGARFHGAGDAARSTIRHHLPIWSKTDFMDFFLRIWMTTLLLLFLSQKTYSAGDLSTLDRGAPRLLDNGFASF